MCQARKKKEKNSSERCRYFCPPYCEHAGVPLLALKPEERYEFQKDNPSRWGQGSKTDDDEDAARIHSAEARMNGGTVPKGNFTARAARAAASKGGK